MASFKSRILAYMIDMLIITVVLTCISNIFGKNNNYIKLSEELNSLSEEVVKGNMEVDTYLHSAADLQQKIDREKLYMNLIQGFLVVGYFIILPYCYNGRTLGKKLFKMKIVSEDGELDYNKLIIRALVIDGLGYLILTMALVYIVPSLAYLIALYIIGLAESIITIASGIMIIKNKKGIHDILSKTKVINEESVEI